MSRRDPKARYDGFTIIRKGVHSGIAPVTVARDQLSWATNVSSRNNFISQRPGFVKRPLTFAASGTAPGYADGYSSAQNQSWFEDGIFEGAVVFERLGQLVALIGGRVFRIKPDTWTVVDATIGTYNGVSMDWDANPSNKYRAWLTEVENWVIIQDGVSIPLFFDGGSCTRSDTIGTGGAMQVPIGKAMCYSQGRLVTTYANGRQFVIGDIVGGDSGHASYNFVDSVLYMTENLVLDGGGAFSVPMSAGLLSAVRPVAQVDTSTGQGPTQVFTTGGIFSLNTPSDRTTWSTVNYPLGTVSNVNAGSVSDRATININGDIWFRAPDGVRSFVVARRDFETWTNSPLSMEVQRAIDGEDSNLLPYASAALYDTRLLMTTRPYRVWGHGICHQGLLELDFEPVTAITERGQAPIWDGIWTGLQVLQVLHGYINGVERTFIFALSPANKIELWEVDKDKTADFDGTADVPIEWSLETKSFTFTEGDMPGRELLTLDGGRLYVDEIIGNVTFTLYYRSDQDPCWRLWHTWAICAADSDCNVGSTCGPPKTLRQQYRKPFLLPNPAASCDEAVNKQWNWGREFQVRLEVTGACRVKMLELITHEQQEDITDVCPTSELTCEEMDCCPISDYSYTAYPVR